ncbi:MAG TPA: bifunctional nuclease domain-containing protein [Acidimicrobiales bacterium]|nr:bifunctional nuclease domain-containing protein [Acidimicrobiales bacterium]
MSDADAAESELDLTNEGSVGADESAETSSNEAFHTEFRVMNVETVTYDLTDASPVVHLLEAEPPFRYLAIPLALPDAVAMHQAVGHVEGRRPGTHELITDILNRAQIDVIAARILRYEGGIFYAQLDLMTHRGHELIDCRTSDAITLALRQRVPAPVLCAEEVLAALYV